jgi:hypothetical protein
LILSQEKNMHFCLFIFDMSRFDQGSFWFHGMPPWCSISSDCFKWFSKDPFMISAILSMKQITFSMSEKQDCRHFLFIDIGADG